MQITPQAVIDDAVVKQLASVAATGATVADMVREFGISKHIVKKIMGTDLFKKTVQDIGDEATKVAKSTIKSTTASLAAEVTRVLTERLAKNDLEAVKVALKVIGFDQEEKTQGDTNIQVVLPGARDEKPSESDFQTISSESFHN